MSLAKLKATCDVADSTQYVAEFKAAGYSLQSAADSSSPARGMPAGDYPSAAHRTRGGSAKPIPGYLRGRDFSEFILREGLDQCYRSLIWS